MSNKQISKDNREYWSNKLSKKFREKRSAVESMHLAEINKNSEKNYPMFHGLLYKNPEFFLEMQEFFQKN